MFLGGGVIAAELGQVLSRFGCGVTIIDRNPRILKVVDHEVADVVIDVLMEEGVKILTDTEVTSCEGTRGKDQIITLEQNGEQRALKTPQVLFAAIGRVPNVRGMDLEKAGVEYDIRRGIHTNEYLQTTAPNIYACGDVTARLKFTHTASFQAEICVKNILYGNQLVNDLSILPWAIFTDPEIGHVGLSERQAREQRRSVQVFRVDAAIDRFITDGQTGGFLKVVMDEDDNILGADAVGAHAGEWIQFITVAMKNKLPVTSLAETIFTYPTYSEIVKKVFTRFLRTKL
jgi:pyruvate/2-oxoglutarate dehydrogenase complex dihydrolipoamide dehydrogenase (E3) component